MTDAIKRRLIEFLSDDEGRTPEWLAQALHVLSRLDISIAALDAAVADDACTDIQRLEVFANLQELNDAISSDEDEEEVAAAVLQALSLQHSATAAAGTSSSTPPPRCMPGCWLTLLLLCCCLMMIGPPYPTRRSTAQHC
ncbi:hypothetical protein OEZ85_002619 [Tetradesmus obliquus]|uniref:Uncharacterized protein n=1 Tax=Tetradesmus obliquus TaxID=3088 RepID=A0ABY8TY37_TETOB|nr:hypothetical protein OEZ85_002619 [Tetradesmus obliquus]